jgi:hypothetical protein
MSQNICIIDGFSIEMRYFEFWEIKGEIKEKKEWNIDYFYLIADQILI